jgi:predicted MPP superfamily phosphohydrolase
VPRATTALLTVAGLGAAGLAYSVAEAHRYTLRRASAPVLPAGQPTLRVLHLSDLHLTPRHRGRVAWVQSLDALDPDLVVVTGDFLGHQQAVPTVLSALGPLLERPGVFVLGSNDYYEPRPVQPWKYLMAPSDLDVQRPMLPWGDLVKSLREAGWHDLSNARAALTIDGRAIDVRGVDDPHIRRDRYDEVAGAFSADADLALGVTHAPYLRVLDAMTADGRRPVVHSGLRSDHHQLRPRPGPCQGPLAPRPPVGRTRVGRRPRARRRRRSRCGAARVRRSGYLALCPGALRLPSRGDPAHAHSRGLSTRPLTARTAPSPPTAPFWWPG